MSVKALAPRVQARRDIEEAVDHYLIEAGERVTLGFIDEVERAFGFIARNPGAGSPRYAFELDLPGLRVWRLRRYPYLVFYVETDALIDVWRVLHTQRDIPSWMQSPDGAQPQN
jgi:toxin ParE1/3/4